MKTRPPYPFVFVLEETRSSADITHHLCVRRYTRGGKDYEVVAFHDFPDLPAAECAIELLAKVLCKLVVWEEEKK